MVGRKRTVTAIVVCFALAKLCTTELFGAVRVEQQGITSRPTQPPCSIATRCREGVMPPYFVSTEGYFASIEWLSSATTPINLDGSAKYDGPSVLLDENDTASCFSFLGGRGGATIVSNSSRYRLSHFTLDNSPVRGDVEPLYYPRNGSLWGLFEGVPPIGFENLTVSHVSSTAVYIMLGSFCFAPEAGFTQTYVVDRDISSHQEFQFSVFYLEISSNWGGSHTCISRLRLHEL